MNEWDWCLFVLSKKSCIIPPCVVSTTSGWKRDYDPSSSFVCEWEVFIESNDRLD